MVAVLSKLGFSLEPCLVLSVFPHNLRIALSLLFLMHRLDRKYFFHYLISLASLFRLIHNGLCGGRGGLEPQEVVKKVEALFLFLFLFLPPLLLDHPLFLRLLLFLGPSLFRIDIPKCFSNLALKLGHHQLLMMIIGGAPRAHRGFKVLLRILEEGLEDAWASLG
jgi:hypothetical protein